MDKQECVYFINLLIVTHNLNSNFNLKLFRLLNDSSTTWNAFWIDSCSIESSSKKISREYGGSRGTKGRRRAYATY